MKKTVFNQTYQRLYSCVVVAGFCCLAGCGGSAGVVGLPQQRGSVSEGNFSQPVGDFSQQLSQARARWTAKNLHSYKFTVQVIGFTLEEYTHPVTITVREGVAVDAPPYLDDFATIEKIFTMLQTADAGKARKLDVNFTADGWPSTASVDPRADTMDDEYRVNIIDVKPL